jgi:hypothetical protein
MGSRLQMASPSQVARWLGKSSGQEELCCLSVWRTVSSRLGTYLKGTKSQTHPRMGQQILY